MKIGLQCEFDAAHRLPSYPGKCARLHGHTYRVEAVLEGPVGDDDMVLDFYRLKGMLSQALEGLDHAHLNEVMQNPTAERIAEHIFSALCSILESEQSPARLVSLKLWEGSNKWVMVDE
ncbi:MAG: 6-carboxytetrahydropterin synthase QueD [Methanosarcinales archaeon]|nr:6-carboxytetrahydropterin synthase QueD [Methanosarcinales archaeon]